MKVKIVKEVKRSDGLWRFACGDVFSNSWYLGWPRGETAVQRSIVIFGCGQCLWIQRTARTTGSRHTNDIFCFQLRTFSDGLLKSHPAGPTLPTRAQCGIQQKQILKPEHFPVMLLHIISSLEDPHQICESQRCFCTCDGKSAQQSGSDLAAGEDRAIEQPSLTAIQSLFHG